MIECNDLYDYGYYIYQNSEYFKFSIDSILLAEFVNVKNGQTVLDLCTGNVPIPLILTAKNNTLKITAIELQKEIYDLGIKSIEKNELKNIYLINCDIKDFKSEEKYDIITCNPPYFKATSEEVQNKNIVKTIARHEIRISLNDIIDCAYYHLNEKGSFYLVHKPERLIEVINSLETHKLGIRRITFIQTNDLSKCEFFLIEASKYKKSDPKISVINIKELKTYKNIFKEAIK